MSEVPPPPVSTDPERLIRDILRVAVFMGLAWTLMVGGLLTWNLRQEQRIIALGQPSHMRSAVPPGYTDPTMRLGLSHGVLWLSGLLGMVWASRRLILQWRRQNEAEREREESHRRLFALMSNLPGVAYRCRNDPDWTMLFLSDGCEPLTGYSVADVLDNRVISFADMIHPEDRQRVWDKVQAELAADGRFQVEYRLLTRSGSECWVWEHGVAVPGHDGESSLLEGAILDNDARKRAEVALAESESRFRRLFDQAGIGIAEIDTVSGRFLRVNQRYCELVGYSAQELMALDYQTLTHREDLPGNLHQMDRLKLGDIRSFALEKRYRRKDGDLVWVNLTVTPLWAPGAEPTRHIAVTEDIDARKRAEARAMTAQAETGRLLVKTDQARRALLSVIEDEREAQAALRESEQRFRATFDQAAVGIARVALNGRWLEVNQRLCDIVGYTQEEMLARGFQDMTHPEDLNGDLALLGQVVSGERPAYSMEKRYVRKSGDSVWIHLTVSLVWEADGNPGYFISIVEDIDRRKQAEAEIQELNEALEQRVRSRTAELETANRELESFTYSVSHDLRAPLRAVTGFTEILARRHRECLNEEGRHYLDNVLEAGNRMGVLIDDLLQYSRTGRGKLSMQPVELAPIVASLHSTFGERIAEIGARLTVREPLHTPLGDPTLLGQIMSNLIENALTYHCQEGTPEITVETQRRDARVELRVIDNGIGIHPDYHRKIFQVFQRLHGEEEYPGTGIGLAIVTKAAHLMNGEVKLESTPGRGSRFTIDLPAAANTEEC